MKDTAIAVLLLAISGFISGSIFGLVMGIPILSGIIGAVVGGLTALFIRGATYNESQD